MERLLSYLKLYSCQNQDMQDESRKILAEESQKKASKKHIINLFVFSDLFLSRGLKIFHSIVMFAK